MSDIEQENKRPKLILDEINFIKKSENIQPVSQAEPYFNFRCSNLPTLNERMQNHWKKNPLECIALYAVGILFFVIGANIGESKHNSLHTQAQMPTAQSFYQNASVNMINTAHNDVKELLTLNSETIININKLKPLFYGNGYYDWESVISETGIIAMLTKDNDVSVIPTLGQSKLTSTTIKHGMVYYHINTPVSLKYKINGEITTVDTNVQVQMVENPEKHGQYLIDSAIVNNHKN